MLEFIRQVGSLTWFAIGVIIVLIYLIRRVSALTRRVDALARRIRAAETNMAANIPKAAPVAGPATVPNAVIAAICAAIDQYQMENA